MILAVIGIGVMIVLLSNSIWSMWKAIPFYYNKGISSFIFESWSMYPPLRVQRGVVDPSFISNKRSAFSSYSAGINSEGPLRIPDSEPTNANADDRFALKGVVQFKSFRFDRYYETKSTLPRNITVPKLRWDTGSNKFKRYMRNVYQQLLIDKSNDDNPIIYVKLGDVGIANQMFGICDGLLLSILNNRTFKYYATAIQPHFFNFPLYNITYPVSIRKNTEYEHVIMNYGKKIRESLPVFLDARNKLVPGVTKKGDFNTLYPNATGFFSRQPLADRIKLAPQNKRAVRRIPGGRATNRTGILDDWYSFCLPAVFKPSKYLKKLVEPFELLFSAYFVVGVHIRSEVPFSDWMNETSFFVTKSTVVAMIPRIREVMKRENSLLYYVADSKEFLPLFLDAFPNAVVQVDGLPLEHVGKDPSEGAALRSVIELYLLSLCDHLVVTEGSGFSKVAVELNSKNCTVDYFSP